MADTIKHTPAPTPPVSLDDGEFAIDEVAGILYTATTGGVGALPLDIAAIPLDGVAGQTLVQGTDGLDWAELTGGGGGRPFDGQPWRVPGLIPTGIVTIAAADELAVFELGTPATLVELRVRVIAGSGALNLIIAPFDGSVGTPLIETQVTVGLAGTYVQNVDQALQPGRYVAICQRVDSLTAGTLTVETIQGYLPWSETTWHHAISMRFS